MASLGIQTSVILIMRRGRSLLLSEISTLIRRIEFLKRVLLIRRKMCRRFGDKRRIGSAMVKVLTMLQTQVSMEAANSRKPAMRVTIVHEQALKTFMFDGDGIPSNITSGYLPFMMIPPGGTSNEATARQLKIESTNLDYGTVLESGRGIVLGDSCALYKIKAHLPLD